MSTMSPAARTMDGRRTVQLTGRMCANPQCHTSHPQHKCGRCMNAYYCSRECQQAHYAEHKVACKQMAAKYSAVQPAAFVGYDAGDAMDAEVVAAITRAAETSDSASMRVLPILLPHGDGDDLADEAGTYRGVVLAPGVLEGKLRQYDLRPDTTYAVPMISGIARCQLDSHDASYLAASVPRTVALRTSADTDLQALLKWRMAAVSKNKFADTTALTTIETANVAQELLCLVDKSVFPTLQLMRALNKRGALMITADHTTLSWLYTPLELLGYAGPDVLRNVSTYNINQAVVILTSGSCLHGDSKDDQGTTVMLTSPLHVLQAFHMQRLDRSIVNAMGSMDSISLPCAAPLEQLLARQQKKHGAAPQRKDSVVVDEESEA